MKMRNDYDFTKRMLNTLRNLNESKTTSKKTLREQSEVMSTNVTSTPVSGDAPALDGAEEKKENGISVVNDVDVKMLSSDRADMNLTDSQKTAISSLIDNFRQQVSQIVEFTPGMTINENQIRLDGKLTDEDVSFVLIAGEESGAYINADMLKLENNVGQILEKLAKFEDTFKTAMEPLITQRDNNI